MIAEKLYLKPKSLKEAQQLASSHSGHYRFIAGGTDVIVNKFQGNESAACLIDLSGIDEMTQISSDGKFLTIGSLVTLDKLKSSKEIEKEFPVLIDAANAVASPMIRKTATLGGNLLCENRCVFYNQSEWWREAVGYCLKCEGDICIATGGAKNCFSKFVSDTAIALISLGANIEIIDNNEIKVLALESIYSGDGVNPRKLPEGAIIKSIQIPLKQEFRSVFKKLRQRQTLEFSSLTTSVTINNQGKIRIVLGGVDPKPVIVEGVLNGNAQELIKQAVKKARIVDNDVYSRDYRKQMISVYLNQSFDELLNIKNN